MSSTNKTGTGGSVGPFPKRAPTRRATCWNIRVKPVGAVSPLDGTKAGASVTSKALSKSHGKQPQKEMQNSAQQLRNVLRAFQVTDAPALVPPGAEAVAPGWTRMFQHLARQVATTFGAAPTLPPVPVLLVDDMMDSGWTLTLAAVLLQHHGSGPVYPFALAKASPRGR